MKIGSASAITFSSPLGDKIDPTHLSEFKQYTIRAIESTVPGEKPFRHLYIEHVLPHVLYTAVRSRMFQHKYNSALLDRTQDSDQFVNKRFSLVKNEDIETQYLRAIFSDNAVKSAFLQHFFLDVTPEFAASLEIHTEFEYMYTAAGRSQNIHVDIPPKFLSFVFYFPEFEVDTDAERLNATVFYDKHLNPQYVARYRPNSLCVFAPHFYSYHGFASTIDREVLVMFYVNAAEMNHWVETRNIESPPFQAIRKAIDDKLRRFSLIEYGLDPVKLDIERRDCLINAPRGRVMKANDKSHVSKTDRYRSVSNITTTAKSESQKYSLNKVVWICWLQGWDRAPWLVRKCLASWQWRNPDWEIRALDSNLLQRYVELPSLEGKIITPASMSDIIRSLLLHEYGGIWVDATVLCHRPLDTWIWDVTPEGFFAFDRPGPDRLLSSWFIAAAEGNLLMDRWHASVVNFWEANDQTDNYFWFHYLFADLCKSDPQFNEQWNLVPKISAIDPHRFQSIGLLEDRDEVIEKALISPPAVSKLTYRYNETARNDKSLATKLMQDFPGPFLPKSTANKVGIVNLKPIASLSVSTQNLGDHMQILAARRLIERASRRPCLYADRDNDILSCSTLPTAYGPYPILINGWFKTNRTEWPPGSALDPVFIGFHIRLFQCPELISEKALDYYRKHSPIGCRDLYTLELLSSLGIECFLSDCLTLSFPRRIANPKQQTEIFVVSRDQKILSILPPELSDATYISHYVEQRGFKQNIDAAASLLNTYQQRARLIVTTMLHCALPAIAMGIPVIVFYPENTAQGHASDRERFSSLEAIIPTVEVAAKKLHLIDCFHQLIQRWNLPSRNHMLRLAPTSALPPP